MFKLIKVDFYDDFACLMSECPDNCCDEEWDIYIDDKTIKLYEKIGVEDLDSKITATQPHKLIKHDGKCPFITPEGLCIFHRDYGEDYLSNTCRSYPRFVSTYGDVYLETLGMSCPATVEHVLKMTKAITFPDVIYYENNDEIGIRPDRTEAEKIAHDMIDHFNPGDSMIGAYLRILENMTGKLPTIRSKKEMLRIMMEKTNGTPSERYAKALYSDEYINTADDMESAINGVNFYKIEEKLNESNEFFACNANRMLLFEHLMLDSISADPDREKTILKGLIAWLFLLYAFECIDKGEDMYKGTVIVDRTYRLMRIIDHGGAVLDGIIRLKDGEEKNFL